MRLLLQEPLIGSVWSGSTLCVIPSVSVKLQCSSFRIFEPCHEIMVLFVLSKLILQMRMRSHPVGLDIWFLVGPFVYFHTSCVGTAKTILEKLWQDCAGSPELFAGHICDKYHNLMSWLIYRHFFGCLIFLIGTHFWWFLAFTVCLWQTIIISHG